MCTSIHGIPVVTDPSLSREETNKLISDLIQDCAWEGRQLGRVELIRYGEWVHVCSYERPSIKLVSVKITTEE
ncbi:hypothetical protein SPSIL_009460 [Sporomusa silvacetica DSM 10669]|uniref:Uncharacterized protein n=1 Tax=Sporomusa silvacetica DSM 10669 TaxID=1123289 RepID=A0ABZ3IGN8_9FIRM|nr:hypothetical protein [Sporomusa silvacetica]OZC13094.1 hypothetical protein SPSIL_55500 [Sporomusa silvacetica DSM 10669]